MTRTQALLVVAALFALALQFVMQSAGAIPNPGPGPSVERRRYSAGPGAIMKGNTPPDYSQGGEEEIGADGQAQDEEVGMDKLLPGTEWADAPNKVPASAVKYKMPKGIAKLISKVASPRNGELTTVSSSQADTILAAIVGASVANDPEASMHAAKAGQQAQASEAGNATAEVAKNQTASAIDFSANFLPQFPANPGNKWNRLRDQLFVPMGILLLLPGALLTQMKSIIAAGSPVLGDCNPWEGIQRSIVAIFLIPGTYLVVSYSIDLSNSITYTINSEYARLFNSDMYRDAICAEIRAFPARQPSENRNALDLPPAQMGPLLGGRTPFAQFEGNMLEGKIEDPCLNIYMAPAGRADEALTSGSIAARLGLNASNAMLGTSWNILCAFQMAYLYYLWFVGPVVAGLWVWPMKQLRNALPSWVEGVVTLAFWALFWNTTILLMACFKGVDETGTIIMSALNFLATSSVKFAFDFAGLVKAAGQEAASMAEKAMKGGGAKGGGGGGSHGGGHSASRGSHASRSAAAHGLGHEEAHHMPSAERGAVRHISADGQGSALLQNASFSSDDQESERSSSPSRFESSTERTGFNPWTENLIRASFSPDTHGHSHVLGVSDRIGLPPSEDLRFDPALGKADPDAPVGSGNGSMDDITAPPQWQSTTDETIDATTDATTVDGDDIDNAYHNQCFVDEAQDALSLLDNSADLTEPTIVDSFVPYDFTRADDATISTASFDTTLPPLADAASAIGQTLAGQNGINLHGDAIAAAALAVNAEMITRQHHEGQPAVSQVAHQEAVAHEQARAAQECARPMEALQRLNAEIAQHEAQSQQEARYQQEAQTQASIQAQQAAADSTDAVYARTDSGDVTSYSSDYQSYGDTTNVCATTEDYAKDAVAAGFGDSSQFFSDSATYNNCASFSDSATTYAAASFGDVASFSQIDCSSITAPGSATMAAQAETAGSAILARDAFDPAAGGIISTATADLNMPGCSTTIDAGMYSQATYVSTGDSAALTADYARMAINSTDSVVSTTLNGTGFDPGVPQNVCTTASDAVQVSASMTEQPDAASQIAPFAKNAVACDESFVSTAVSYSSADAATMPQYSGASSDTALSHSVSSFDNSSVQNACFDASKISATSSFDTTAIQSAAAASNQVVTASEASQTASYAKTAIACEDSVVSTAINGNASSSPDATSFSAQPAAPSLSCQTVADWSSAASGAQAVTQSSMDWSTSAAGSQSLVQSSSDCSVYESTAQSATQSYTVSQADYAVNAGNGQQSQACSSGVSYVPVASVDSYPTAQVADINRAAGSTHSYAAQAVPSSADSYAAPLVTAAAQNSCADYSVGKTPSSPVEYTTGNSVTASAGQSYAQAAADTIACASISNVTTEAPKQHVTTYDAPRINFVDNSQPVCSIADDRIAATAPAVFAQLEGSHSTTSVPTAASTASVEWTPTTATSSASATSSTTATSSASTISAESTASHYQQPAVHSSTISGITTDFGMSQAAAAACVAATVMGDDNRAARAALSTQSGSGASQELHQGRQQVAMSEAAEARKVLAAQSVSHQAVSNVHSAKVEARPMETRMQDAQRLLEKMNAAMATNSTLPGSPDANNCGGPLVTDRSQQIESAVSSIEEDRQSMAHADDRALTTGDAPAEATDGQSPVPTSGLAPACGRVSRLTLALGRAASSTVVSQPPLANPPATQPIECVEPPMPISV